MTQTQKQNSTSTPSPTTEYFWVCSTEMPLALIQRSHPDAVAGKVVAGERTGARVDTSDDILTTYPLCLRVCPTEATWEVMFKSDFATTLTQLLTPQSYRVGEYYVNRTARNTREMFQLTEVYRNHIVGIMVEGEEQTMPRSTFEQDYIQMTLQDWIEARLTY